MPAPRTRVSEEAVRRATGRGWSEWFAVLDRLGHGAEHAAMAGRLRERHGLSPWWSRCVTLTYQRARGLRKAHGRRDGTFEVGVQRTVDAPRPTAFAAWTDARSVSTWFTTKARQDVRVGGAYRNADGDRGTYLAVDPPRRLRFTWDNPGHCPGTVVEVTFAAAGPSRTVVRLRHSGLASEARAQGMKTGWTWALASCAQWARTGEGLPYETWSAARARRPRRRPRRATRPTGQRNL